MEWNQPKVLVVVALFGSLVCGAAQPIFGGLIMSEILTYLSLTALQFEMIFPGLTLEGEVEFYCILMVAVAAASALAMWV